MYLISDAGASCNEKDTIESVMLTRNLNYLVGIKLDVKETIDNVFVIAQSNNLNVFAMSNYQISNLDYSFLKKIKFPSHIFKYYIPTLEEILINYNHDKIIILDIKDIKSYNKLYKLLIKYNYQYYYLINDKDKNQLEDSNLIKIGNILENYIFTNTINFNVNEDIFVISRYPEKINRLLKNRQN